jgi:putative hydrolase of the HAD superfamily
MPGTELAGNIKTIFFDVGNTLRIVLPDQPFIDAAEKELMRLTETKETHDEFFAKLEERWKAYRKLQKTILLDNSEMEMWMQYLLPEYDKELIAAHAPKLTRLWRDHDGRRVARKDAKATLLELCRRGYTLGIIANTITETEIPDWMTEDKVAHCFKTVILSSKVRIRKPDPAIYHLACRCIGSKESECAYVGDNPVRDVEGTRAAGFGMMIRIDEPDTLNREKATGKEFIPDAVIESLSDLLNIFPERKDGK